MRKGFNPNEVTEYTVESDTITFIDPSWEAYEEGHWNISYIPHGSTGHKVISAVWESPKQFEVTFDLGDDPNASNLNGATITYTVEDYVNIDAPTSPGYENGQWQTQDGVVITSWNADTYWEDMALKVVWGTPKQFSVVLDFNGGTGANSTVTATYGLKLPTGTIPTKKYYRFGGFVSENNGLQYYNTIMQGNRVWYQASDDTLKATWLDNYIVVTLVQRGGSGSGGVNSFWAEIGGSWPSINMPYLQGYYNQGYFLNYELPDTTWQYYDENGNPTKDKVEPSSDITLFTAWHPYNYYIVVDSLTAYDTAYGVPASRLFSFPNTRSRLFLFFV